MAHNELTQRAAIRLRPVVHLHALLAAVFLLSACQGAVPPPTAPTVVPPTVRPALSAVPAAAAASDNVALGQPASAALADQPPSQAVDGDPETIWSAGGHPSQFNYVCVAKENLTLAPLIHPELYKGNVWDFVWVGP